MGQVVKVNGGSGAKDAIKTVSCSDPGTGYILVRARILAGTGTSNMWNLWIDDAAGANLARWYGAGTNARGRIAGTMDVTPIQDLTGGWDSIDVKIHPASDTSEFFFNGTSIGTLSHASQGAGNSVGRIRLERVDNGAAAGNSVFFAVLRIGESATDTNDAQIISDTIPTTMTAGLQYNVSVTVKNIGATTWTQADGYKLGAVDDSDPFADGRQLLTASDSIGPDQQKTFSFTMTAPSTPGEYTTDWRMLREFVEWFGGSVVKQVQVNPGTVTISNSTFDSNADGWSVSVWKSGPYDDGVMAWSSSAGRTGGGMRCNGSGASDNTDRCAREGGEIQKTISTSGYSNIKVSYDLRVNSLGQNRTGSGSGSCTVDHNLIDEQITVFYSTNGGSSWTEAEWLKRSDLLASYQSYGTRVIDLTGVSAVNNNPNFRLRFRWQLNSPADTADLDNIKVISN